jgi:hypothetical protein
MTCIKTSMMTWWITTPPIINDLQNEIYFIILLLFINLQETRHVRLYLWPDFHCKAMQEILSSSNKYLVLWNIPNVLKTCIVHFNSTYPQHHPTKSMMACMFRRVRLVPGLISSRNQIHLLGYFLYILDHTVGNICVLKPLFLSSRNTGLNHSNNEWYKPKVIFVRFRIALARSPKSSK